MRKQKELSPGAQMKQELINIQKNIDQLEKDRKFYKIQSEWFKMLYPLYLKKEFLENYDNEVTMNIICKKINNK